MFEGYELEFEGRKDCRSEVRLQQLTVKSLKQEKVSLSSVCLITPRQSETSEVATHLHKQNFPPVALAEIMRHLRFCLERGVAVL